MFAAIPFLFAVQQVAEGAAWSTMRQPAPALLHGLAVNVFLGIGLVVWPIWLPLSLSFIERGTLRRWGLAWLSRFGAVVSTCAAVLLLRWRPGARIVAGGLTYDSLPGQDLADQAICVLAYFVSAVLPFFLSSERSARRMGVVLVAGLILAAAVPPSARTSLWSFCALVLSGLILVAGWRERLAAAPAQTAPSRGSDTAGVRVT